MIHLERIKFSSSEIVMYTTSFRYLSSTIFQLILFSFELLRVQPPLFAFVALQISVQALRACYQQGSYPRMLRKHGIKILNDFVKISRKKCMAFLIDFWSLRIRIFKVLENCHKSHPNHYRQVMYNILFLFFISDLENSRVPNSDCIKNI